MNAQVKSFRAILSNSVTLRIPFFQRRYVWTEKDWCRFAEDMESTIASEKRYFLGAVILKEEGPYSDKFLVIDGQQRLTTFTLYMKALSLLTLENTSGYLQDREGCLPILEHNREDRVLYDEIMGWEMLNDNRLGNYEQTNIVKAFSYFVKYLKNAKDGEVREGGPVNLINLRRQIESKVVAVEIVLHQGDDEQQIFDTINSLGVPLTTGELMKNFLYRGAEDNDSYDQRWRPVFDVEESCKFWDQDRASKKQSKGGKNSNIEVFFYAFARIKMWDFSNDLTPGQRKNFVKAGNVFETCKSFVEDFNMTRQDLANEILSFAQLFKDNFDVEVLEESIPRYSGIKRIACLINATKTKAAIPYILYILKNVSDEAERNRIFGFLESYLIRRILVGSDNNSYSEFFAESLISNRILTYDELRKFILDKPATDNLAMPSDERVRYLIQTRDSSLSEDTACSILYMYVTKLPENGLGGFNDYIAKQFMPIPTRNNNTWERLDDIDEEEQRERLIGTIGNFFLMDERGKKELKSVHNAAFNVKIEKMRKWGENIIINREITTDRVGYRITGWTAESISDRNENLAKRICEQFPI